MSPYLRTKQMDDGLYYVLNEKGERVGRGHFSSKGAYLSKRAIEKYTNRNARRAYNATVTV